MKLALRFALTTALVFGLLMAPWPGLRAAYASLFRVVNEISFSLFWRGGDVHFERHAVPSEPADTYVRVVEDGGASWYTLVDSWGAGWLPTAVFLALVLATPIPRPRRLRALLFGALLVHLYVASMMWINLLEGLTRHAARCASTQHGAWLGAAWWHEFLATTLVVFRLDPSVFVAVPVLVWLLVSVRRSDLETWAGA